MERTQIADLNIRFSRQSNHSHLALRIEKIRRSIELYDASDKNFTRFLRWRSQFHLTLLWIRSTYLLLHKTFTLHRH